MEIISKMVKRYTKKLQDDCPSAYQVAYSEFGPVVAAHLGSGGLGLGYVGRKIRLT